jgi:ATP-dependent Clp protease ATP-binding subunit ClpC
MIRPNKLCTSRATGLIVLEQLRAWGHLRPPSVATVFQYCLEMKVTGFAEACAAAGVSRACVAEIVEVALTTDSQDVLRYKHSAAQVRSAAQAIGLHELDRRTQREWLRDLVLKLLTLQDEPVIRQLHRSGLRLLTSHYPDEPASKPEISRTGPGALVAEQTTRPDAIPPFVRDLVADARAGVFMAAVGREKELQELCETLSRFRLRNAFLVGPPGAGKSALAEEFARRVAERGAEFSSILAVFELDLGAMLAGTATRGSFEERFVRLRQWLEAHEEPTLLFIDEAHQLLGTGRADGAPDLANLLKPLLARGNVQVLAATTEDEYRRVVEQDKAFKRRFKYLAVGEPPLAACLTILTSASGAYAEHHGCEVDAGALVELVRLGALHNRDQAMPDKALQMLDWACSRTRATDGAIDPTTPRRVDIAAVRAVVAASARVPLARIAGVDDVVAREWNAALTRCLRGRGAVAEELVALLTRRLGVRYRANRPVAVLGLVEEQDGSASTFPETLAQLVAGRPERVLRLTLAQFEQREALSRLVGAAPGLIGYEDGGALTEPVRRDPYTVVVIDVDDELPGVGTALIRDIVHNGFVTDGRGRTVDFTQTFVLVRGPRRAAGHPLFAECDARIEGLDSAASSPADRFGAALDLASSLDRELGLIGTIELAPEARDWISQLAAREPADERWIHTLLDQVLPLLTVGCTGPVLLSVDEAGQWQATSGVMEPGAMEPGAMEP